MLTINEMKGRVYLDRMSVENPYPTDIYEARLLPGDPVKMTSPEGDYLALLESYPETVEALRYSYCAFVRFGDAWRTQGPHVWINYDAGLRHFNERFSGLKCYLGEWRRGDWPGLRREMGVSGCRTYVMRRKWYDRMREMLLETGIGISEEDLDSYIGPYVKKEAV